MIIDYEINVRIINIIFEILIVVEILILIMEIIKIMIVTMME
jgi:hypothetical protein